MTNEFLTRTHSEAALVYHDQSVNENMHLTVAFRILRKPDNNFLDVLNEEAKAHVRQALIKARMSHHAVPRRVTTRTRLVDRSAKNIEQCSRLPLR